MSLFTYQRQIEYRNPLYPYSWQVAYYGGGHIQQFDADGYHYSRDVDLTQLMHLDILGHPHSPIRLFPPSSERGPDELILWAVNDIVIPTGGAIERKSQYLMGFRYGAFYYVIRLDESGRIFSHVDPKLLDEVQAQSRQTGGMILWPSN